MTVELSYHFLKAKALGVVNWRGLGEERNIIVNVKIFINVFANVSWRHLMLEQNN